MQSCIKSICGWKLKRRNFSILWFGFLVISCEIKSLLYFSIAINCSHCNFKFLTDLLGILWTTFKLTSMQQRTNKHEGAHTHTQIPFTTSRRKNTHNAHILMGPDISSPKTTTQPFQFVSLSTGKCFDWKTWCAAVNYVSLVFWHGIPTVKINVWVLGKTRCQLKSNWSNESNQRVTLLYKRRQRDLGQWNFFNSR